MLIVDLKKEESIAILEPNGALSENDIKYNITKKLTFKIKTYSLIDRFKSIP